MNLIRKTKRKKMKRQIRFRAWLPNEKTMIGHREVIERAHLQFDGSLNASDIVMQFTGLLDRNGREIYESDIVVIKMGESERFSEVIFESGGFIVEADGFFGTEEYDTLLIGCCVDEMDEVIVIGNIHENPELLNQKKP